MIGGVKNWIFENKNRNIQTDYNGNLFVDKSKGLAFGRLSLVFYLKISKKHIEFRNKQEQTNLSDPDYELHR